MKLKLVREILTSESTIGSLYTDDVFECYTLEDPIRYGEKIPGETAIPEGTYQVVVNYSPRFDRLLPLLIGVPNYTGVRFHWGNTARDTLGCILTGRTRSENFVGESRIALEKLFEKIRKAIMREEIWLEVTHAGAQI